MPAEKSMKEKVSDFLHEKNAVTDALKMVEEKTGVNRIYLAGGLLGFLGVYLVVGYACDLIVAVLGFLYPAYASVKAIESTKKDDDTQWLTYWVVFGAFSIVEYFSDIFLSWFPLYFLMKCMFLGWCMAPFSWNGSTFIYHRLLKPFVVKHQEEVDQYLKKAQKTATKLYDEAHQKATEAAIKHVSGSSEGKDEEDKKDE